MGQPQTEAPKSPVTVEGLEHVFADVVDAEVAQGIPGKDEGTLQEIPSGIPNPGQEIPPGIAIGEAAKLLGTSPRAIIKRLQKGTLKGFKVPSKFGEKWLVDPQGIPGKDEGTLQEIPSGIPNPGQETPPGVPVEIVQELMRKVEALTYRNGYLEAQLAEKETHIKLLTDSQHKAGWWVRFCSWFSGR